jgi:hypothetical protein
MGIAEGRAAGGLTGLGPGGGGVVLTGGADPSPDSSSCLLMSRVVNRLDSRPRMWMMASLLEGLGWRGPRGTDKHRVMLWGTTREIPALGRRVPYEND